MASQHPRIQVTVDPELAEALALIDPIPKSRSRLVRDLAVKGAEATVAERRRTADAKVLLRAIADGADGYDLDAAAAFHAGRTDRLP